eukprot:CAMPEP_0177359684 /NCGR_PEP_ID=MMETSP0368-20130122/36251_1 /TAXON_ID=447022 ORGANISM="Scrippsiella hangoei-like, Strain SHHI-4" /NCGR_SAMPLE_ID=MMETSP0368 /ASSEMBLY_ACC=CAM_ASM_000363 /LENGTH=135 /DNA_ID=CAMNT_0018822221 /DNA_START=260 /DNA_END=665 /DNA_ORIENTATION=-
MAVGKTRAGRGLVERGQACVEVEVEHVAVVGSLTWLPRHRQRRRDAGSGDPQEVRVLVDVDANHAAYASNGGSLVKLPRPPWFRSRTPKLPLANVARASGNCGEGWLHDAALSAEDLGLRPRLGTMSNGSAQSLA